MLELGQFIKEKRISLGLTQKALGKAADLSDAAIQRIESGSRLTPNWTSLCKIANALEVHPFVLLEKAGYITVEDLKPYTPPLAGLDQLNAREIRYLQLFTNFILSQKKDSDSNQGGSCVCNTD